MAAVRLEAHGVAGLLPPVGELVAYEPDLLPEVAHHPRRAGRGELDDGGDHLDDAAVEVDRPAEPERLEFPTETWAAQDMRKSDVFALDTALWDWRGRGDTLYAVLRAE